MKARLADLDLSVQGATIVDLGGRVTPETWTPWGCSYGTRMEDWTPEKGEAARKLSKETEAVCQKATKAELRAFLVAHGQEGWAVERAPKNGLVTMVMIFVNDRRYPRKFINPKVSK